MDKVFLQIINMSITSSYVILFVIVARLFLKKVPKIFSYVLWSVVLFRLVCPFSFESIFSLIPFNKQTVPQNIMYLESPQIDSGFRAIDKTVNKSLPAQIVGTASANPMEIWITLGEFIWLLGIVALVIYSVFTTIRLYKKIKFAEFISDNIYEMDEIKTPFVFGIIEPKIYLPINLFKTERDYVIKHEQIHIRRFDHIIKPFAFFVLCIHWFNPLVWIAFFLMGEDMELSCDESVIKEMGNDIKKDYSTSLLSMSTGKRIIGGSPLTFGENNIKGRIKNILSYKKPRFWVVVVVIISVVIVSIGLISDPHKKQLTVVDYANQFVEEEIRDFENIKGSDVKIVDRKITKLEKMDTFYDMLPYPIEIWRLEYHLKPDDINKVMIAGGLSEVDGWITEYASGGGKVMLIFSYEHSKPHYLGNLWGVERDLTTIAGRETELRSFLEGMNLLPHETYKGKHILVKFPISTGETCQLFLSQPVIKGDSGIWCVERWMDGNGNIYYVTPDAKGIIGDYYKELQKQCDDGHKQFLLDPLQVAFQYINNDIGLGQNVSLDELVVQYYAKIEDFQEVPESHFIGFISDFNIEKALFHLDRIEWLTDNDTERLRELNIDANDMPNGFYIHNPNKYPMYCEVTDQTQYSIINWGEEITHKSVTLEEFIQYLEQYSEFAPPFRIVTKEGYVKSIIEQYVP
ncbi:M56 family metallopeptidase [Maledivibacter halophilus]|uniref:Signal transducer regulating beta-lactamase production, contains metallopeptidase domain n=1 Tax=Maledivibacter halophilus TaxID=36842 RepID=A0A1T5IA37_9FIRM|nr:M56 family metallopeptidase [Maledivibacter halophilus]SKC36064.1 Signal transducer regulating beta-lactamase production, contains metallopeptidase domain [Maledivibacter halophilus]